MTRSVLISVWLNTSKDAVVGNEQKSGTFRKRVGDIMQQVLMLERVVNQESISIVSRGGTKSMTSPKNYVVHMRQQRDRSVLVRMTIDLLKVAHDIFYSDHNTKFNLEHAWCVLRYEQK